MATTFEYVDTSGQLQRVQATDTGQAREMAKDIDPQSGFRAIPADQIQPTQQLSIPPTSSVTPSPIPEEARITSERERQEFEAQQAQRETDQSRKALTDRIADATGIMQSRPQLEEDAGIPQARIEASEIRSQIEARELALRRQIEQIERTPGLSQAQINRLSQRAQRDGVRELADLAIVESAKLRRLDALETNIDRRIKAELEPKLFELQFYQQFYQENRERMNDAQNKAFQLRLQEEERAYQAEIRKKEQIGQVAMTAAQYGANATQIGQIFSSGTFEGAIEAGAQFLGAGFALQVKAQQHSEYIARANLQMQQDAAQAQALGQQMIANLFAPTGSSDGVMSFDEYVQSRQAQAQFMGPPSPTQMKNLRQEYNDQVKNNVGAGADKQQQIGYMVAMGMISPQQATFLQESLRIQTPQQLAKQQMTITRGSTVLRDVERALDNIHWAGAALGTVGQRAIEEPTGVFGTISTPGRIASRMLPSYQLALDLESIKSNISIEQLQAMRESSPTGGALGQIQVKQQEYLMSVLGSLRPTQNRQVLENNLNDLYNIYLDAMFGSPQELQQAVRTGMMTAVEANSYLNQRKQSSFNDYNLPAVRSGGQIITNYRIAPDGSLVNIVEK